MFSLSEMKLLMIQLTANIKQTQLEMKNTKLDNSVQQRLENKLITLTSIKQKISNQIEHHCDKENHQPPQPRTLIVDDSGAIRNVMRSYFLKLGFEQVDVAADGSQAWERLQQGIEQTYEWYKQQHGELREK